MRAVRKVNHSILVMTLTLPTTQNLQTMGVAALSSTTPNMAGCTSSAITITAGPHTSVTKGIS